MKKKKTMIVLAIAVLLIIGGAVWAFRGSGVDPQLKKVQEMQKELHDGGWPPNPEKMEEFRKEMDKLTPKQRDELMRPRREEMERRHEEGERRMTKDVDGYFALPPNQRKPYLDKKIQEMEKHRKEWEQRRRDWERNHPQSGPGQNRGGQPGQGQNRGGMGPNQQAPQGQGNANRGGPPGGRRNRTPAERAQRRNQRLDRTTPEQRAKRSEYFDALRKRRLELGLPANPWGRGPRGH